MKTAQITKQQATKQQTIFTCCCSVLPAHGLLAKINYAPPPVRLSTLVKSFKKILA